MKALLPFKGQRAKSRWEALGPDRYRLSLALLDHVVQTVVEAMGADSTYLVTPDPAVAERSGSIHTLVCPGLGLNQDLSWARRQISGWTESESLLVVLPDLPYLGVDDLKQLIQVGSGKNGLVLCPDQQGVGTNAVLMNPWNGFDFQFEGASFERYSQHSENLGYEIVVLKREGLSQDCDSLEDVKRYAGLL